MTPATQQSPSSRRYAAYVTVVLIVVYVFNFIDRQILSILAEELKADLGITDAEIGFLYGTAFAVFYAVFGIPLARLADVWVRRRLIALGLAFWSLMTALSGTARSFGALALCRFGVGVGEASATPAAFSMLGDYYPPRVRATVLAVYSSGIYIGAGIGLFLGGAVVDWWRELYPAASQAPMGIKPWQAAFLTVGLPGLAVALWVWTLREPERGATEGIKTPAHPRPFHAMFQSLASVLPPLTCFTLARLGGVRVLMLNLAWALGIAMAAWLLIVNIGGAVQWVALGIGVYATVSWVQAQKLADPATFGMMFGSKAFVLVTIGFPAVSFVTYGVGFWSPAYMLRVHDVSLTEAGLVLGLGAAVGGMIGIISGGILADWWRARHPNGRLFVGMLVLVLATPFALGFLFAEDVWVAYACSFAFSIFSPAWIGSATSTVNDLVLPRMRATASAYYVLMNTFLGLALGPYLIGQISDHYITAGADAGSALRGAMSWALLMFAVSAAFLLLALRFLHTDESTRLARARELGEAVPAD